MRALGVITARAFSKRLPGKNLLPLNGHPLLAYICRAALASRLERVILSTEDDRIADVGIEYGIEAPFRRPVELAADFARNEDIISHALDWAEANEGQPYGAVVKLQPTTPFALPEDINACLDGLTGETACCFSARTVAEPPQWMFVEDDDGFAQPALGGALDDKVIHSQLLPKTYIPTGAAFALSVPRFRAQDRIYCTPMKMVAMNPLRAIDIDEEIDFLLAEKLAEQYGFGIVS